MHWRKSIFGLRVINCFSKYKHEQYRHFERNFFDRFSGAFLCIRYLLLFNETNNNDWNYMSGIERCRLELSSSIFERAKFEPEFPLVVNFF